MIATITMNSAVDKGDPWRNLFRKKNFIALN